MSKRHIMRGQHPPPPVSPQTLSSYLELKPLNILWIFSFLMFCLCFPYTLVPEADVAFESLAFSLPSIFQDYPVFNTVGYYPFFVHDTSVVTRCRWGAAGWISWERGTVRCFSPIKKKTFWEKKKKRIEPEMSSREAILGVADDSDRDSVVRVQRQTCEDHRALKWGMPRQVLAWAAPRVRAALDERAHGRIGPNVGLNVAQLNSQQ